jgi:hypothetical protein
MVHCFVHCRVLHLDVLKVNSCILKIFGFELIVL